MSDAELKLECLKLAWTTGGSTESTLDLAKRLYTWLNLKPGHPVAKATAPKTPLAGSLKPRNSKG
jgi:hypothetical protein